MSPCHSRQPSVISDASAAEGDRSSTPSDINSPRHRTHSLCNVRPAAAGPGPWAPEPAGAGGGVKTYPLFPLVHPGSTLAKAFPVLFFPFARRDGCGERKKGGPFASCVREGKENPEEGGPGTAVGSVQPGLPLVGCVWNRGLLPDVPPQSSGPHQHTSSSAPGLALRPSSWNELDFFLSFQEL